MPLGALAMANYQVDYICMYYEEGKKSTPCDHGRTKLYQANGDILLNCKAWNGRVVMQFLAVTLLAAFQDRSYVHLDDRLPTVALCMTLVHQRDHDEVQYGQEASFLRS